MKNDSSLKKNDVISENRTEFSEILSKWLKKTFGRGASKKIQENLLVGRFVADQALTGHVSIDTLMLMIVTWKEPFINEVIKPLSQIRSNKNNYNFIQELELHANYLKSEIQKISKKSNDSIDIVLHSETNGSATLAEFKNIFLNLSNVINQVILSDNSNKNPGDELRVFSGKVLFHENISISKSSEEHALLLKIYQGCDGYFNDIFSNQLIVAGNADAVSIYDENINVRHIGNGTIFWNEEQRRSVVGRSVWQMPAPKDYLGLVYNALASSVGSGMPNLNVMGFRVGANEVYYDRMVFPFPRSGLVVAVPRHSKR